MESKTKQNLETLTDTSGDNNTQQALQIIDAYEIEKEKLKMHGIAPIIRLKILDCSLNLEPSDQSKLVISQQSAMQASGLSSNGLVPDSHAGASTGNGQHGAENLNAKDGELQHREPRPSTFDARINHLNTHIEGSQYLDL